MNTMSDEQLVLTACYKLGIPYEGEDDTSETVAKVRRVVRTVQANEISRMEGGALAPYILSAVREMRRHGDEWDEMLGRGSLTSGWVRDQNKVVERDPNVNVNDHYSHPLHRVFVAMSGGLDSTAVYHMAREAGRNVVPVYVDVGQPYVSDELAALSDMGVTPEVVTLPQARRSTGTHMIYGRNARMVMAIAGLATSRGLWGDIWFGNVMGESHVTGSDKSSRFFNTLQAIVHAVGHEIRLVSPLIGLEKTDIVRWYVENGYEDLLGKIRPCVADSGRVCGKCHACAKTIFAMEYVGVDWRRYFGEPQSAALREHAEYFILSMEREPSHYAVKQVREIRLAIEALRDKGVI